MSAYMVKPAVVDFLLTSVLFLTGFERPLVWSDPANAAQVLTPETASRVGTMLLAENRASVNHRYGQHHPAPAYRFGWHLDSPAQFHPSVVIEVVDCYEYQACEHPGWLASEAAKFCAALRHRCDEQPERAARLAGTGRYVFDPQRGPLPLRWTQHPRHRGPSAQRAPCRPAPCWSSHARAATSS